MVCQGCDHHGACLLYTSTARSPRKESMTSFLKSAAYTPPCGRNTKRPHRGQAVGDHQHSLSPVSYTHLDVYKRQELDHDQHCGEQHRGDHIPDSPFICFFHTRLLVFDTSFSNIVLRILFISQRSTPSTPCSRSGCLLYTSF